MTKLRNGPTPTALEIKKLTLPQKPEIAQNGSHFWRDACENAAPKAPPFLPLLAEQLAFRAVASEIHSSRCTTLSEHAAGGDTLRAPSRALRTLRGDKRQSVSARNVQQRRLYVCSSQRHSRSLQSNSSWDISLQSKTTLIVDRGGSPSDRES